MSHATLPCGATRLVFTTGKAAYRLLWCRRCWTFHPIEDCELRPAC